MIEAKTIQRAPNRALSNASYQEEDFPALRLARAARVVRRVGRVLIVVLVVSVLAMFFAPWQQSLRGDGAIIAFDPFERPQSVQAPIKGRVAERGAGVRENAFVTKGQLLFRLEDQDPLYLSRLEQQLTNAQNELATAERRLERAGDLRDNQQRIIEFATEEIEFMQTSRDDLMTALDFLVDQARNKESEQVSELEAANAKLFQTKADHDRQSELFKEGIASQAKQQEAEQKYLEAKAKVAAAEQKLDGARNGVASKVRERESKRGEIEAKIRKVEGQLEKARAELAKAEIDINKTTEEINQKRSKLLDQERKVAVQRTQEVRAPRDGRVINLTVVDTASIVKPGDELCRIVPDTTRPAVEIYVDGNDAPLIHQDDEVRLQFEGWPAVQFSGWPSVAVGTFGGRVSLVDATDNGAGKFRVVVVPDPGQPDWPDRRYLRQGVRANGWVLLDQVSLGYEVWRRMNGFPPSLDSAGSKKKPPKPPKVKT